MPCWQPLLPPATPWITGVLKLLSGREVPAKRGIAKPTWAHTAAPGGVPISSTRGWTPPAVVVTVGKWTCFNWNGSLKTLWASAEPVAVSNGDAGEACCCCGESSGAELLSNEELADEAEEAEKFDEHDGEGGGWGASSCSQW